jgi:hypothetical protein
MRACVTDIRTDTCTSAAGLKRRDAKAAGNQVFRLTIPH